MLGAAAGEFATTSLSVAWVLTQRGCHLGAPAPGSLKGHGSSLASSLRLSPLLCPSLPHSYPSGQGPFLTLPISHFKKPVYCSAPRQNTLHNSNLYIWQIKLDIIVILVL